jgi:5-methyltetrahydropteroyltriglutamate--homocysteine methyltransferase
MTTPINPTSIGRKKLESLGIKLPVYPVMMAGLFPKHEDLKEIRYKVNKGVQPLSELERKEKLSTDLWIREQERSKVDIFVDGGMNRDDAVAFFAKNLGGCRSGGFVRIFENAYYRKPIISAPIEWKTSISVPLWHYAQRLTHKPVKAIITGPYTLMDWSFNEHYSSREELCRDLTTALRKEIAAHIEHGVKIIQINEPAFSAHPDEFPLFTDSLTELTRGFNAYFILYHSYGDLSPFWDKMQNLPVDQFQINHVNSLTSILPVIRKKPSKKDICIGVMEAHALEVETPRLISGRIRDAIKSVPAGQLWFSFDAGLQASSVESAIARLLTLTQLVAKGR